MHWIATYTKKIAAIAAGGGATELSFRTPIENMLTAAAADFGIDVNVLQEPSRRPNIGAPDFRISNTGGGVVGYVECKTPGENLRKLTGGAQLKKYRALSGNIVLTDSWRWILLRDGKKIATAELTEKTDRKTRDAFTELLRTFMETEAEKIGDAKRLAAALAGRCALLRGRLEFAPADPSVSSLLHGLLSAFRAALDTQLQFGKFVDVFSQTLVYSLLMAKLNAPPGKKLDLYDINRYIPANFALIREIAAFVQSLDAPEYRDIAWVIDDILEIINTMDAAAITESMSYHLSDAGMGDEDDPYIYFYENFLVAYDADLRERRGVYYTPPPVVKFIVRAADDVLRRDFNLPEGLAATDKVTALDFAAGTGTFMLEMFRIVFENAPPARRNMLTRGHLCKNFYGFELLMAPYVISHLKLSQFLADNGAPLNKNERINIFLANTLEKIDESLEIPTMPKLSEEASRAQQIKDSPVLVITGNPPYSGISQNRGKWITELIETYKHVDGEHFGEARHWLHDDYVKFIRFAQWKMENVERGLVAIITNHAFLDNPTFRGMRQSLMNAFDALYFLDLHGNSNKKETAPDGGKDENVFDIRQGVAISLLIKNPAVKEKGVFHAGFYGARKGKYQACMESTIDTIKWKKLTPNSPFYFFAPHKRVPLKYQTAFSITDIFRNNVTGIVTARDTFAIDINQAELLNRMKEFSNLSIDDYEIIEKFELKETRGWKIEEKRKHMAAIKKLDEHMKEMAYRPFDDRWVFYHSSAVDWMRKNFMRHMLVGDNVGIATVRQVAEENFNHVIASTKIVDFRMTVSNRGGSYFFPLHRYDEQINGNGNGQELTRNENFEPKFRKWINKKYGITHTPEDILACIYAIMHSQDYRTKYADFLRTDFPRIPFPDDNAEFKRLAGIGVQLIQAHLLREHCDGELAKHCGTSTSHIVEKVKYDDKNERLYFNKDEYFAPLPTEVFNFQIGGYRPLDKYLKSRKTRNLTIDETNNVKKTANAIAFTIEKMREIDR